MKIKTMTKKPIDQIDDYDFRLIHDLEIDYENDWFFYDLIWFENLRWVEIRVAAESGLGQRKMSDPTLGSDKTLMS